MGLFDIFKKKSESNSSINYDSTNDKLEYEEEPSNNFFDDNCEFGFIVEDAFAITGKGTVVTGEVLAGSVSVGDVVKINDNIETRIMGIEMFRKILDTAQKGDNVGLLLGNIKRNEVTRGDTLTK